MKTPREILLQKHAQAGPKLDELRKRVLAQSLADKTVEVESSSISLLDWLMHFWTEVLWQSRRVWLGLAAVWVVTCVLSNSAREDTAPAPSARNISHLSSAARLQQQIWVEIANQGDSEENENAQIILKPESRLKKSRLGRDVSTGWRPAVRFRT